uniref:SusC/RagA family TonB-linked outer membrane protein n=1 Tax=Pedobacter schmidteae TaxID=2201271 RepID=UPI0013CED8BC|nr:SusC/RagA family TonB-linked outer membrane protein [Pedobacter schmidteae]
MLNELRRQTGFDFIYTDKQIKNSKPVTINVNELPIEAALVQIFKEQPLAFTIDSKTVMIREKESSFLEGLAERWAAIDIRGVVRNERGEALEGITVAVKGTNRGTTTNAKGEFVLNNVDEKATLVFSGIAIETYEVKINGKKELNVNVRTKQVQLENVEVVSTGYQDIPKERATGSFVQVDNELLNRNVTSDIISRLKGVASGMMFDKSTGNALGISVRGRSTMNLSSQPLIVVDNFPFYGNVNTLNPNDFESVTILKDAAAASIWGASSGNGVIVLKTKKGRYNQNLQIDFNSSVTFGEKPRLKTSREFINSSDYIDMEIFLFSKDFYKGDLANTFSFPPLSPVVEILDKRSRNLITPADSARLINELRHNDIRDQYSKYFYRKSVWQQYALNLRGGTDKANYYVSGGYDRTAENLTRNNNARLSFTGQFNFSPIKDLEISVSNTYSNTEATPNGVTKIEATGGRYQTVYPYVQLADENGTPLKVLRNFRNSFSQNPPVSGLLDWTYTPLDELQLKDIKNSTILNRFATGISYSFLNRFSLNVNYQGEKSSSELKIFQSQDAFDVRDLINKYSSIISGAVSKRNIPLGAIYSKSISNQTAQSGRVQLNYFNSWENNSISSIVGFEANEIKTDGFSTIAYGYDSQVGSQKSVNHDIPYALYPNGIGSISDGKILPITLSRKRSYFFNTTYAFLDRYYLSVSLRKDESNLFGVKANQKGVPLWSTGVKWDIDKEKLFNVSWLNRMQFRATYGFNGNFSTSTTAFPTAIYLNNGNINNIPYANVTTPGNPEYRWERIRMLNLGIDFGILNNTISGSIEYYYKKGLDIIGIKYLPISTGFPYTQGNYSSIKGKGIDVTLRAIAGDKNFRYVADILLNYNTDRITKNEVIAQQIEGNPINSIYSYRWAGLDPTNGDPIGYLDGKKSKDYDAIISKASANPQEGYMYNGSASPQIFGSLRNSISFKGFDLSFNVVYKFGYYFKRTSISYSALYNNGKQNNDFSKRWKKPGDELTTNIPSMIFPASPLRDNFYEQSAALVERGDNIQLQDVRLSYDLKRIIRNKIAKAASLYFYANNLGMLWSANNLNIDPENELGYRTSKTFSIGVNISL